MKLKQFLASWQDAATALVDRHLMETRAIQLRNPIE